VADNFSPLPLSARRYGGALFDAASQASCLNETADIAQALAALLRDSGDMRDFIASPLYNAQTQERFIAAFNKAAGLGGKPAKAAAAEASALLGNFLAVMAENRRLAVLPQALAAFAAQVAKARGDVDLYITSAEELSADQEKRLLDLLTELAEKSAEAGKHLAGKNKILHKRVDAALLGGFIVRCGPLLIDASVRSKLSSLKLALKEVG